MDRVHRDAQIWIPSAALIPNKTAAQRKDKAEDVGGGGGGRRGRRRHMENEMLLGEG